MKWSYHLNKTERKGFTVVLVLFAIVLALRIAVLYLPHPGFHSDESFRADVARWHEQRRDFLRVNQSFDPNRVDEQILQSFHLPAVTIQDWERRLKRKQFFSQPEDLLSLYAMDTSWFEINRDLIFLSQVESDQSAGKFNLVSFNPNLATEQQLLDLGIPSRFVKSIVNYRNKGGKFKKPDDLLKIYHFPAELYEELRPFIRIPEEKPVEAEIAGSSVPKALININLADSVELLSLKGVGPARARNIIAYRDKLGGFVHLNQLTEVYGITPELAAELKDQVFLEFPHPRTLNINTASFKQLLAHPYLNYDQVKAMVNFRDKMGGFKNVEDIVNLPGFSESDLFRLKPYLTIK